MEADDKKKILLVDDDQAFLEIVQKNLEEAYLEAVCLTATSGEKALEMIKDIPIDLLITDIFMSNVDGFELLIAAKKQRSNIKVIMMSAHSDPDLTRRAYEKGSIGYIEKPFTTQGMITLIKNTFAHSKKSFDGEMEGIQIVDIIQLNCLAKINSVVFLKHANKKGSIFFENGEVVHAESNGFEGETALREIMNWPGGDFSTKKNTLSPKRTISKKWEQLLIETIVSIDESQRGDFILSGDETLEWESNGVVSRNDRIRVLVVDDSSIILKGISDILSQDPQIEVVGGAKDGRQGLEMIARLQPDVVTMDVNMPEMDGLTALKHIMILQPTPVVMLSAYTVEGAAATFDSLRFGAVDFIAKPNSRQDLSLEVQKKNIIEKVKRAADIRISSLQHIRVKQSAKGGQDAEGAGPADFIIAIGAALGGYGALLKIISRLPADLPAAVLIVQYMPDEVIGSFSEYLNNYSSILVKPAQSGQVIKNGVCYLCADSHYMTTVYENNVREIRIHDRPFNFDHRNSFNMLLISLAETFGSKTLGVVLSGEGVDGLEGAQELKRVGGKVFAQEQDTCLSPEMPAQIIEHGLADKVVPDFLIAHEIVRELGAKV